MDYLQHGLNGFVAPQVTPSSLAEQVLCTLLVDGVWGCALHVCLPTRVQPSLRSLHPFMRSPSPRVRPHVELDIVWALVRTLPPLLPSPPPPSHVHRQLEKLVADPALAVRMGAAGRALVEARFRQDVTSTSYELLFRCMRLCQAVTDLPCARRCARTVTHSKR